MKTNSEILIKEHSIELSHLDKIFYPQARITKGAVINYYDKIAEYFIPHIKDHMVVMHRYPNGLGSPEFYQKSVPDYFPSWIDRKTVDLKHGGEQTLVLIQHKATLIYLSNQGVLVYHSWLSTANNINNPDKIVFDLDPSSNNIGTLRFAAEAIKKTMEEYRLIPFVMTTGSRGYHVVIPIKANHTFEKVHNFAKKIAHNLANQYPRDFTIELNKSQRQGRVFIDYLRNSFGQTSVAPYSLREREGAPVATPIEWDELSTTDPQKYNLKNIFRRLGKINDPWLNFSKHANNLLI